MADRRRVRFILPVVLIALSGILSRDARSLEQRQLEQALAKVTVIQSGKPVGRGTGFAWKRKDWVVTSLHSMRPDATYQIERPGQADVWAARPISHLKDHDLVLLELYSPRTGEKLAEDRLPSWTPYRVTGAAPGWRDEVFTVGYYLDTPSPRHISLKVSKASGPLEELIPTRSAGELKKVGIPNISLDVVHFQGPLLPGYSGAPMFDASGRLVAIGDGGLEFGAVDISWGIKAQHLQLLETATGAPLPADLSSSSDHYMAHLDTAPKTASVKFGPYEFVYQKTRSLGEMIESSDNPEDLRYQLSGSESVESSALRFDVYQDLNFGLVIAVPANHELAVNREGDLEVRFGNYRIAYDAGSEPEAIGQLLAEHDIHRALTAQYIDAFDLPPEAFELDADGSSCDRSLEGGVLATLAVDFADPDSPGDAQFGFAKMAIRGQQYLSSEVILDLGEAEQVQNQCAAEGVNCGSIDPSAPCAVMCRWLHAITSVYLTSFSNFRGTGRGCLLSDQPQLFATTDSSRTIHGVLDWAAFGPRALDLARQGLHLADLEVVSEGGQWLLGGIYQPLPLHTYARYGADFNSFSSHVQAVAQQGYQLKDVEVTWDGTWKYAGVFQSDARATRMATYQDWQQMLAGFQQAEEAGWSLIDLELPPRGQDRFFIVALYQYNAGASAYRFGDWARIGGFTTELASRGFQLTDLETYWDGQTQWFAGVYSRLASPSVYWVGEWPSFEKQTALYKSQGRYLDDLEIFAQNGTRWAMGVFR